MEDKQSTQPYDCVALRGLIPAYCLGATDPDETVAVQAHLAQCTDALEDLASFAALAETLLYSAPPAQPPAHLAAQLHAAISPVAAQAPTTNSRGRPLSRSLWQRLAAPLRMPHSRWSLAAGAMALALLLAVSLIWNSRLSAIDAQQRQMAAVLQQQNALLAMIGQGNFQRVALPAGPASPAADATATVVFDPTQPVGLVFVQNLPQLAAGQAYQMWLIQGEERSSGGLFVVSADGSGVLTFTAPQPLQSYDAIGITREPAAGSPGPTTPPVIKGNL